MEENNHIIFSNSKILNLQQTNLAERIHVHAIGIDMVLSLVHTNSSFIHILHVMLTIQIRYCILGVSLQITG